MTDENVIKIVEEVLLNEINPDLVNTIQEYGVEAESVTVKKNNIIYVEKAINPYEDLPLPEKINTEISIFNRKRVSTSSSAYGNGLQRTDL